MQVLHMMPYELFIYIKNLDIKRKSRMSKENKYELFSLSGDRCLLEWTFARKSMQGRVEYPMATPYIDFKTGRARDALSRVCATVYIASSKV